MDLHDPRESPLMFDMTVLFTACPVLSCPVQPCFGLNVDDSCRLGSFCKICYIFGFPLCRNSGMGQDLINQGGSSMIPVESSVSHGTPTACFRSPVGLSCIIASLLFALICKNKTVASRC